MKISVVKTTKNSRGGSHRTSDGFFWGWYHKDECLVYLERTNISFEEAIIIQNFIDKYTNEGEAIRADGPETPILTRDFELEWTNELITLLIGFNYTPTNDVSALESANSAIKSIIQNYISIISRYENEGLMDMINYNVSRIKVEKEYLSKLISNAILSFSPISISEPENVKAKKRIDSYNRSRLNYDKELLKLLAKHDEKFKFFSNSAYCHEFHGFSHFISNDEYLWSAYPLDIAIYLEDVEKVVELCDNKDVKFNNIKGLLNLTLKHNNTNLLYSNALNLKELIKIKPNSVIVEIIENDSVDGVIFYQTCIKNDNQLYIGMDKFIAGVLSMAIEKNSKNIFNYIIDFLDLNNSIIGIITFDKALCDINEYSIVGLISGNDDSDSWLGFGLQTKDYNCDSYGITSYCTPLGLVCYFGRLEMVKSLITKKVNINDIVGELTAMDIISNQIGLNKNRLNKRIGEFQDIYDLLLQNGGIHNSSEYQQKGL